MRKNILHGLCILCISIIFLQFSGCNDSSVIPESKINVSGKAVNLWGEPVEGIQVYINGYNDTIITLSNGLFSFSDITVPYDMSFKNVSNEYVKVLTNLSSSEIIFYLPENSASPTNTCNITVSFSSPPSQNSNQSKFIFTDGDKINSYSSFANPWNVKLRDKSSVTGKLIYIGYNIQNNKVVSYENFGVKEVTLSSGGNHSFTFDSADIAFNPVEDTLTGYATNYTGGNLYNYYTLWFGSSHTANYATQIALEPLTSLANFNFIVPSGLPIPFRTIVYSGSGNHTIRNRYEPGSEIAIMEYETVLNLIEPPNGATNVTLNTYLSAGTEGRNGIYIFTLINGSKRYLIYSDSPTIQLSEFIKAGFIFNQGTYSWGCQKLGDYESVNAFANNPWSLQEFQASSEVRTFTIQ